jgi:peptidoglycan pentaglycine glycine transferase (the first glycine)
VRLRTWLEDDPYMWDAFVEAAPYRSFSQLWEWGELRREGGWVPFRLAVGDADADGTPILAGAQIMVRRVPIFRTALGYVPRGPFGALDDDRIWSELLASLRRLAVAEHLATIRFEPEATISSPLAQRFNAAFWRRAPANQPTRTRVVDLTRTQDELRADMRKKHRQYVSKAERAGLTVEHLDATTDEETLTAALADFHRILTGTGTRAGFNTRPLGYYRDLWRALAPANRVRLYFAARDGNRLATLFHITCGDHAAELYGGASLQGTESHANYLVKWGAILGFRQEGFATYDLWGEPTEGIAHFKEGFGGEPMELVGARDLVVNRAGDLIVRAALTARDQAVRLRSLRSQPPPAASVEGFREATETDAVAWQALLEQVPSGDVLHDWQWAAVAELDGTPARRLVLEENNEIVAIVSAQVRRTALGHSFWYVPRGPVLDFDHSDAKPRLQRVIDGLRVAARADKAIAVRLEPRVEGNSPAAALFDEIGLKRIDATLQTPDTRLVDLLSDDDALLATFDKDTRYAIRRAEREGVTTAVIDDPNDDQALADLHALVTETLDRANYRLPSLERYRAIWHGLAPGRARIIQARHGDALEASGLLVVEGDRSIYLYAGSIREAKGETKRFPSYAAQWQMMRTAREMGSRTHDLWGVAPEDTGPDHPWHGYSLFKKGFGGRFVSWAGSWDLVIDPLLYRVRDLGTRIRRR